MAASKEIQWRSVDLGDHSMLQVYQSPMWEWFVKLIIDSSAIMRRSAILLKLHITIHQIMVLGIWMQYRNCWNDMSFQKLLILFTNQRTFIEKRSKTKEKIIKVSISRFFKYIPESDQCFDIELNLLPKFHKHCYFSEISKDNLCNLVFAG